LSQKLKSFSK